MSMFNRTVKLQFNRMKYADLKNTKPQSQRFFVANSEVMWSRSYFFSLGFICMAGLINFDINKYKFWKGVMRWRHRVEGFFGYHHHGHEHGLVGDYPGAHHDHDDHGHDNHGESHAEHHGDAHSSHGHKEESHGHH